jgi:ABC-2 type transport system permease protein/oleandomycin transport system permease protein
MATVAAPTFAATSVSRLAAGSTIADTITMTWRNLRAMTRVPQVIVISIVQPIILVLTFRYVFGGAIKTSGDYVDFLMPGIFVLTVAFGAINTGVGLSEDLHKGLIERFRSLPIARSAVLAGRTLADLVRNLFVVVVMVVVGFLVGFDIHAGWVPFIASVGILLLFGFALSWVFAMIGLCVPNAESAQAASFPVLGILVFASTAFVPLQTMPGWLQDYNKVQPVSVTVGAARALALGGPTAGHVFQALLCAVAIVAVFAPPALARYRRAA